MDALTAHLVLCVSFAFILAANVTILSQGKLEKPHQHLISIVLLIWFCIWLGISACLYQLEWNQEGMLWNVIMTLLSLMILASSFSALDQDTMILSKFLGSLYQVDASEDAQDSFNDERAKDARAKGGIAKQITVRHGIAGSNIVCNFPRPLARGYILPLSVLTVPFDTMGAITFGGATTKSGVAVTPEPATPVTAFISLQIRLSLDLKGLQTFARYIPILQGHGDLTAKHPDKISVYQGMDPKEGIPKMNGEDCSCIAALLRRELQPTFDEAVSRAISENLPLSEAMQNKTMLETLIMKELRTTIVDQAGLLQWDTAGDPSVGPACALFDINIDDVVPSDKDTYLALSAETKEKRLAKGIVAKAHGKGQAITIESEALTKAGDAGVAVLASKMFQDLPEGTTLFAGTDLLSAAAANLVKPSAKKGTP